MLSNGILTWAEIDLDAIAHNVRAIQAHVGEKIEIIAVVKANAYGHGAIPVARTVLEAGATRLAVHRIQEGVELRQAGITAPILLLGYTSPSGVPLLAQHQLTPSLVDREIALQLAEQPGGPFPVHVKVDTGMSRYGLTPDEALDFIRFLSAQPNLIVEGIFSHFAAADAADAASMLHQWETFHVLLDRLEATGLHIPVRHICHSPSLMRLSDAHMEAVRPGVALYGMEPSDAWNSPIPLRRALTLKSTVVRVFPVAPGTGIGYGHTFIAPAPMTAALIPIGYGDGYHRMLSNRGQVLIRGQRAKICGRVSMDQIVVDVTHIPDIAQGDEVVLIGRQGEDEIRAEEVGRWAETINYEITTALLPRVTRAYIRNAQIIACLP